ncbi:UNVERIFIED_CONTAM: Phospholipase A I [Sesamum radiatum]|uniref:Phospholipase A I n=1 Tax=Sesamum radiatum TaxID=300843 RepID=A0AAW2KGG2_SESRA
MSWGLGWKRPTEVFHLTLSYGSDADTIDVVPSRSSSTASSLSVSSSASQDAGAASNKTNNQEQVGFRIDLDWNAGDDEDQVALKLQSQRREPLKGVVMWRAGGSGQQSDGGLGVLVKLMRLNFANGMQMGQLWGLAAQSIGGILPLSACVALPVELTRLPLLEKLYLDNNKLSVLPPELGELKNLKVLAVDYNMLVSVPDGEQFLFVASRHKLSAFFSLIFRFSSCHHPLLASALAKIMQDEGNRVVVGKDENAVRQLISMISSENQHVVEQACSALSALASDVSVAMQLIKSDIMQPIERVFEIHGVEKKYFCSASCGQYGLYI